MSIQRFIVALHAAGLTPEWEDVRDSLWLAALTAPASLAGEPEIAARHPTPAVSAAEGLPPPEPKPKLSPSPDVTSSSDRPAKPIRTESLGIYLPQTTSGTPVRIGDTGRPLSDRARIVRELRPIKRRVATYDRTILDVDATVERIAETNLWNPVLISELGRWLDLNLIIEDSLSMALWGSQTRSLVTLLSQLGAFRRISVWHLDVGEDPAVLRAQPGEAAHDPREIIDPTGRTVTIVLSDGVGDAWSSRLVDALLVQWSVAGPVAVWQALPPRLWRRTAMRPLRGSISATRPAQPTGDCEVQLLDRPSADLAMLAVPVVSSGDGSLAGWARLLATGGSTTSAVYLLRGSAPRVLGGASPSTSPADIIARFRADSSAAAMRLAVYFSAMPLTVDTMRIAQQVMLPESSLSHLAEVFLGGLLQRTRVDRSATLGRGAVFDFVPGVREALLSAITRTEALAVLNLVAEGSSLPLAQTEGFRAVLADPSGAAVDVLDVLDRPFARVASTVLARLGDSMESFAGSVGNLAEQLDVGTTMPAPELEVNGSLSGGEGGPPSEGQNNGVESEILPPRVWEVLIDSILAGECTPFVGAGVAVPYLPGGAVLAAMLAEQFDYPLDDVTNLARVTQYIASLHTPSFAKRRVCELLMEAQQRADEELAGGVPQNYLALARLGLPLYLTTNYDDYLERAVSAVRGVEPNVVVCRWSDRLLDELPSYSKASLAAVAPTIFHMYGHMRTPNSILLTEDDYIDFTVSLARRVDKRDPAIPHFVRRALGDTSMLFVGYGLEDWSFRTLMRYLMKQQAVLQHERFSSISIQSSDLNLPPDRRRRAEEFLELYLKTSSATEVYWSDIATFSNALEQRMQSVESSDDRGFYR